MLSARQQSDHTRLRRALLDIRLKARSSLEHRSPQRGHRGRSGRVGNGRNGGGHDDNNDDGDGRGRNHGGKGNNDSPGVTTTIARPQTTTTAARAQASTAINPTSGGSGTGVGTGAGTGAGTGDGAGAGTGTGSSSGGNSGDSGASEDGTDPSPTSVNRGTFAKSSPGSGEDEAPVSVPTQPTSTGLLDINALSSTTDVSSSESTNTVVPVSGVRKTGLPGPAVAAIVVISVLLFLLFLVMILRRRWIMRRHERMNRWWYTGKRNSQTYGDKTIVIDREKPLPSIHSARSSFATSFDRAATPLDLTNIVPTAPPMAEVRRQHNGSDSVLDISNNHQNPGRFSVGSIGSNNSNDSNFFVVHHPANALASATKRPVSNSESFKFPKPPSDMMVEAASIHSRPVSGSTFSAVSTPNKSPPSSLSRPPLTPPPAAVLSIGAPNAIPNPFINGDSSDTLPNPFTDDPFNDSHRPETSFSDREIVQRPYQPTLRDEIAVQPNDEVKIIEIFDDGWAVVEKLRPGEAGQEQVVEQGLIPIRCLRDPGQDLSTFLNTKRVQSYYLSSSTHPSG